MSEQLKRKINELAGMGYSHDKIAQILHISVAQVVAALGILY